MHWQYFVGALSFAAGLEYCDSTLPGQQLCSNGVVCDPNLLDCSMGAKACLCGSQIHFCDSTAPQTCNDGTPCSPEHLDCSLGATKCKCGRVNAAPGTASIQHQQTQQMQPQSGQVQGTQLQGQRTMLQPPNLAQAMPQGLPTMPQFPQGGGRAQEEADRRAEQRAQERKAGKLKAKMLSRTASQKHGDYIGSSSSGRYYCDSTAASPQSCHDGTPCSAQYLDCATKGPRRCICENGGGAEAGSSRHMGMPGLNAMDNPMMDIPTTKPRSKGDGQPGGNWWWQSQGEDPIDAMDQSGASNIMDTDDETSFQINSFNTGQIGGAGQQPSRSSSSKNGRYYCDSTSISPQTCHDGTPCSSQYLDCTTKGPTRCICESSGSKVDAGIPSFRPTGGMGMPVPTFDQFKPMDMPAVKPPRWGSKSGIKYCDSTANRPQTCQDGTPCSSNYLDCTTKGPRRCICGSTPSSGGGTQLPNVQAPQWKHQPNPMANPTNPTTASMPTRNQQGHDQWQNPGQVQLQDQPQQGSTDRWKNQLQDQPQHGSKKNVYYCDSTALSPQTCKDGTPCSSQYLDCATKGPRRCICANSHGARPTFPMRPTSTSTSTASKQTWQQPLQPMRPTTVATGFDLKRWLDNMELGEYENLFRNQDLTEPGALAGLNDKQLAELGFSRQDTRNRIMNGLQQLQEQTVPTVASGFNVRTWLNSQGAGSSEPYFRQANFVSREAIAGLKDSDLKAMGLQQMGLRNRLLSAARLLQQPDERGTGMTSPFQLGTPQMPLSQGTQQMSQGTPQMSQGTPQMPLGASLFQQGTPQMMPQGTGTSPFQQGTPQMPQGKGTSPFQQGTPSQMMPQMPQVLQQGFADRGASPGLGGNVRMPGEWHEVAERLGRFFPSLPRETVNSAVVASKGDGQKAAHTIRQSTGLEPQEYVEIVEEYDINARPARSASAIRPIRPNPLSGTPGSLPGGRVSMPNMPSQRGQGSVQMPQKGPQGGGASISPMQLPQGGSSISPVQLPQFGVSSPDSPHPGAGGYPFPSLGGRRR